MQQYFILQNGAGVNLQKTDFVNTLAVFLLLVPLHSSAQKRSDLESAKPTPLESLEENKVEEKKEEPPKPDPIPMIKRKKEAVDPKFRQGTYYIEHPNATKGLYRIDKEQDYYYRVEMTPQNEASTLSIGTYEPTELTSPDDTSIGFSDIYDETNFPILLYDYERQFYKGFGRLAWKLGGGLYLAQGNGVFETPQPAGDEPPEKFTLFVVPLNFGFTYRFQYFNNQWLVPYAEGGLDAFLFAERRDDNQNPPLGAFYGFAPAAHATGGLAIPLGTGARSFLDLDREYGINAMYFTASFRYYFALSENYDFTGEVISGGITVDY